MDSFDHPQVCAARTNYLCSHQSYFPSTYFGLCHSRTVDLDFDVRGNLKRLFCKVLDVLSLATGGFQRINTSRFAKQDQFNIALARSDRI